MSLPKHPEPTDPHSPFPWRVVDEPKAFPHFVDANGIVVLTTDASKNMDWEHNAEMARKNAKHVEKCLKACSQFEDPEEAVRLLKEFFTQARFAAGRLDDDDSQAITRLGDATYLKINR